MKQEVILTGACLLLLLGIGLLLFQISKSRTFQFFGEIYPRVETTQKAVALTFDDGPTRTHTDEILEILREENVQATFFLIGSGIEANPGKAEKIVAARHELGNHTDHHERMIMATPDFVSSKIERTDELIKKAVYQGEITSRSPYGKKIFALSYYLSEHRRKTTTCDVEPETYAEKSDDIIKHTIEHAKRVDNHPSRRLR